MGIPRDDTHDAGEVGPRHPVNGAGDRDAGGRSTLALISDARQALAEARTLPDIRRVMEAASVAADAGRRAAKLAEAHGLATDVVRDAEAAANDAAEVRAEYVEETKAAGEEISTDGLLKHADAAQADEALASAVERYPFLADVPGHPPTRLVEMAATLDAADEAERGAMEDQARRWCDAQRELVPQWRAEDEVTRMLDGVTSRLAHVNSILSRHRAAEIADLLMGRLMPDNDVEIVRMALGHLSELERELATRQQIRRVK